jgi:hypothetical protein
VTAEKKRHRLTNEGVLTRLVRKYLDLSDVCYRVSVAAHDRGGRFKKGHRGRRPHPALLKKVDLDRALAHLYRRFFEGPVAPRLTSTSKSRCHGRENLTSSSDGASSAARRSE